MRLVWLIIAALLCAAPIATLALGLTLAEVVERGSAIRGIQCFQFTGGPDDKVFSPICPVVLPDVPAWP